MGCIDQRRVRRDRKEGGKLGSKVDKDAEKEKLQVGAGETELGSPGRGLQKASKWDAGEATGESAECGHLRNAGGGEGDLQEDGEVGDHARELGEGGSVRGPRRRAQSRRAGDGPGGPQEGLAVGREGALRVKKGCGRRRGWKERREVNWERGSGRAENGMGEGTEDAGNGLGAGEGAGRRGRFGHLGSLPAGRRRRRTVRLRNSPALSPALPFFSGGGGDGGRDDAAHSGGSSAPGLGCCVLGGGGSGGGSGPTRAVTIVRGSMRSLAEPLSSRRRPWLPALVPPAPSTLRRPRPGSRALRLRVAPPARRAPPPPPRARAPALTHNRSRGVFPRSLRCLRERHTPPAAHPARLWRLWRRMPPRHLSAHCATRHSDTCALSHCPNTTSRPHPQPPSPGRTTWENRRV